MKNFILIEIPTEQKKKLMRYKKFDYTKLTLPCLALVRNLKFEDDENGMGKLEFGDIIKISKIRKELIDLIPEPNPIKTRKQLKRLIFREELLDMMMDDFDTLEEVDACPLKEIFMDIDFSKSIDHIVDEMFDNDPYYFNCNMNQYFEQYKIKDRDIFNESYVIGFFVSSNYEANFDYLKAVAVSMMKSGYSASKAINHLHYFYLEQMLEGEWNEDMSVQDMFERLNEDLPKFINGIKKLPDDYDYLWDK